MVQALSAFMDFCYLVWWNILDESTLDAIDTAVGRFHANRVIFEDVGVHDNFSLPHQHSVKHFWLLIQMFSAPNGLCSSITESKHIKAVKEPYQWSSHFEALGQMLLANQKSDKLSAFCVHLSARSMLDGPCLAPGIIPILPVHHWQEIKVSQHSSSWWFRVLILMFFCSAQVPLESTWTCNPNKPAKPPELYSPISIQPTPS